MILADRSTRISCGSAVRTALPLLFLFLAGCGLSGPHEFTFTGEVMGTEYHVKVVSPLADDEADSLALAVRAALEAVDAKMSTYKPDSELSRFNQHASTEPFPISREIAEVFDISLQVSEQSGGGFDVTVGPLVNAYGFGPEKRQGTPSDAEIEQLRARVGYKMLTLDRAAGTIRKSRPDIYADLSAVAKGFGVDAAAAALNAHGVDDYMVEVGGEVRTRGLNLRGEPWQIAIEKPITDGRAIERVVPLSGKSMATSGEYRNYYEEGGRRISHTIDARTGRSITHALASVSVIHEQCAWADAYATAINVLGPEEGYTFAVEHNLPVLLIVHDNDAFHEKATPAFEQFLKQAQPPGAGEQP